MAIAALSGIVDLLPAAPSRGVAKRITAPTLWMEACHKGTFRPLLTSLKYPARPVLKTRIITL